MHRSVAQKPTVLPLGVIGRGTEYHDLLLADQTSLHLDSGSKASMLRNAFLWDWLHDILAGNNNSAIFLSSENFQRVESLNRPTVIDPLQYNMLPSDLMEPILNGDSDIYFISHSWVRHGEPDDEQDQQLHSIVRHCGEMHSFFGVCFQEARIWVDCCCVLQDDDYKDIRKAQIRSIPAIILMSSSFLVPTQLSTGYFKSTWCFFEAYSFVLRLYIDYIIHGDIASLDEMLNLLVMMLGFVGVARLYRSPESTTLIAQIGLEQWRSNHSYSVRNKRFSSMSARGLDPQRHGFDKSIFLGTSDERYHILDELSNLSLEVDDLSDVESFTIAMASYKSLLDKVCEKLYPTGPSRPLYFVMIRQIASLDFNAIVRQRDRPVTTSPRRVVQNFSFSGERLSFQGMVDHLRAGRRVTNSKSEAESRIATRDESAIKIQMAMVMPAESMIEAMRDPDSEIFQLSQVIKAFTVESFVPE